MMAATTVGLGQGRLVVSPQPPVRERPVLSRPVDVDCAQGQTISAALERLKARRREPLTPPVIRISGTCNESVLAEDLDDLTIMGLPGATLIGTTTGLDSAALTILGSRNVTIKDITIDAPESVAVRLHTCQFCTVQDVSITGGVDAINVRGPSSAKISGIDASGLTGCGVVVREQAWVELRDSVIEGEGTPIWAGVFAHRGGEVLVSGITVRGFKHGFSTGGDSASAILGALEEPGEDQTIRLEDNTQYGICVLPGGQVKISYIPIVISGNGRGGVASYGSSVELNSDVEISGHPFCGVEAGENASIWLGNALINGGQLGIYAHRKSLVKIAQPVTISDTGAAILAVNSSQVVIGQTVTLFGNAHDVTCDALSEIVDSANLDTGGNPLQADCPNLH
jgi:hypothetical protein